MIRRTVRFFDERLGLAPALRKQLRYVFPDHWSFMLGEIALYAFVVLVITGVFISFYYVPSDEQTVYTGAYEPLRGMSMSENFVSTVYLSLDVPAGLLMRQTHHWAAVIFLVSIVMHLLRILLTGAFRKPREINYAIGVSLLGLGVFEGFTGYSLPDDLLSGMGLVVAYAVLLSVPIFGADLGFLAWGGEFPGGADFWPRLFTVHILIIPAVLAILIGLHLVIIMRQHHTQFGGERQTESNVVGIPAWPGYLLRSIGLFFAVSAALFLLGGLVQINPIWQWGPYETDLSTGGAQPDWYIGWLIGGMRITPPIEIQIAGYTLVPNAFWGGFLFPTVVFAVLLAWPAIDKRLFRDTAKHQLLDRPRDNPRRTAIVLAFFTWVLTVFLSGGADQLYLRTGIPYEAQIWVYRVFTVVAPFVVYFITRRVCEELLDRERRARRAWAGKVIRRTPDGAIETLGLEEGVAVDGGDGGAPQREPVGGRADRSPASGEGPARE